jgi:hypothetical protein
VRIPSRSSASRPLTARAAPVETVVAHEDDFVVEALRRGIDDIFEESDVGG